MSNDKECGMETIKNDPMRGTGRTTMQVARAVIAMKEHDSVLFVAPTECNARSIGLMAKDEFGLQPKKWPATYTDSLGHQITFVGPHAKRNGYKSVFFDHAAVGAIA